MNDKYDMIDIINDMSYNIKNDYCYKDYDSDLIKMSYNKQDYMYKLDITIDWEDVVVDDDDDDIVDDIVDDPESCFDEPEKVNWAIEGF